MNEKENYNEKDQLLKEAYEMTHNSWLYIKARELDRAVNLVLNEKDDLRRDWVRKEAVDEGRQLEVIHLILLVRKIDIFNLSNIAKQLEQLQPEPLNFIQPLFVPEQESDNSQLLDLELNSGYHMVISKESFLFKPPTEI